MNGLNTFYSFIFIKIFDSKIRYRGIIVYLYSLDILNFVLNFVYDILR